MALIRPNTKSKPMRTFDSVSPLEVGAVGGGVVGAFGPPPLFVVVVGLPVRAVAVGVWPGTTAGVVRAVGVAPGTGVAVGTELLGVAPAFGVGVGLTVVAVGVGVGCLVAVGVGLGVAVGLGLGLGLGLRLGLGLGKIVMVIIGVIVVTGLTCATIVAA
jgi:hypothetical protein